MDKSSPEYEARNELWHKMLAEIEPDERDRIRENPTGQEALALAISVELAFAQPPEKRL